MKTKLINYLKELTQTEDINLSQPPKPELGDFAFPTFPLAKQFKKNPAQIAQELAEKIQQNKPDFIQEVQVAWPYLNFKLSSDAYSKLFQQITTNVADPENKNKTIFVDYIW